MKSLANIPQREWDGRAIALLDLDAFFASVEQLDHPEWRNKPVIVGGSAEHRGVVATASYEARKFGVHSAMPSATARRLCPDAIWTCGHFERYHELSDAVMHIMYDSSPLLERVSIDEAFLDITPGHFQKENPVAIAVRIQERVADLGITCSIGIGTGKMIAKIASDLDKPQGLSVVYPGSESSFLAPMEVRAMPGIGKRGVEQLAALGIETIGELAAATPEDIHPIFGTNTSTMLKRAAGYDPREIVTKHDVKSVSNERTFVRDLTKLSEIEDALDMLGSMVGRRLRKKKLAGYTVVVKLRYADLSIHTAQRTLSTQVDDETIFLPVAKHLIAETWRPGMGVRLVGLGICGFETHDEQVSLFEEDELPAGNPKLVNAADNVRERFGNDAIKFGRELKLNISTASIREHLEKGR